MGTGVTPGPGEASRRAEPAAGPGTGRGTGSGSGAEAGDLLGDLSRLRRRARAARHAYWFPLVLFGLLTCAAAPLYVAAAAPGLPGSYPAGATFLLLGGQPVARSGFYVGWYWAVALAAGYLATVLWYWRHARRAGVRTPARGYLVTGIAATAVAIVLPPLTRRIPRLGVLWLPFGDAWIRGTLAFLIIAAGLWVLARAERSRALAVTALVYTAAALLASLYNIENVAFRLGWTPTGRSGWRLAALPNVLLPAVVLLTAGTVALIAQRRRRPA